MSTKIPRFYIIILLFSVLLFIFLEWAKPREVSWETTFLSHDKMPYGTYAMAQMLPQLFPEKQMDKNNVSYFEFLNEGNKSSIIIISEQFQADKYSVEALLNFVALGGEVFISALSFDRSILDTLGLKLEYFSVVSNNKFEFNYLNESLKTDTNYSLDYGYTKYFNTDSCYNFEAIGSLKNKRLLNFIKISIGDGFLFLNSNPLAFTNYNILSGNTIDYVEKAFSLMEVRNIVWDEYSDQNVNARKSLLQYIANNPYLKVAYYISMIMLLLFAIFYGKRRQKLIPIIEPVKNNSLEFVDTISKLYLQQQEHHDIADKLILYFLDHIYLRYKIKSRKLNEEFIKLLSQRSGKSEDNVRSLIVDIRKYQKATKISRLELLDLNKKIETYYQS